MSLVGPSERRRRLLATYARVTPALLPRSERRFQRLLAACVLASLSAGALLSAAAPLPAPPVPPVPQPVPRFRLVSLPREQPVRAEAAAPLARRSPPRRVAGAEAMPTASGGETPSSTPAPARRVYGVREVHARGLGAGGGAEALVVKPGNSVDGRADSLQAGPEDLPRGGGIGGAVEALTLPVPLQLVKPRYSEAMLAARARGAVRLRLLVDTAGAVADLEVLADIGYDSAALAAAAARQFRFAPARRGGVALSQWIEYTIRFTLEDE